MEIRSSDFCAVYRSPFRVSDLFYDEFPGGDLLLLEDLDEINTGIEPGKVQLRAKQCGFQDRCAQDVVYTNDFWPVFTGYDVYLALGSRVWEEFEVFNTSLFPHLLGQTNIRDKKKNQGV